VPAEASLSFLALLEAAPPRLLLASDWDVVRALVRSGVVSLSNNPTLLIQALECRRVDILALAARYLPDLGERDAVWLIKNCVSVPAEAYHRLFVADGCLRFGSAPAPAPTPASAPAPASASKSQGKGKGKGKAAEKEPAAAATTPLLVLRLMAEALLLREGAFTSLVLGDAIRANLSQQATCLLLRVFVHMLTGLCSPAYEQGQGVGQGLGQVHLSRGFRDIHVRRAITWAEALLDAHFASTALMVTYSDRDTVMAMKRALETVRGVHAASKPLEGLIGNWTHVVRTIAAGADKAKAAPVATYQLETLTF
jgi:hypothetical protein